MIAVLDALEGAFVINGTELVRLRAGGRDVLLRGDPEILDQHLRQMAAFRRQEGHTVRTLDLGDWTLEDALETLAKLLEKMTRSVEKIGRRGLGTGRWVNDPQLVADAEDTLALVACAHEIVEAFRSDDVAAWVVAVDEVDGLRHQLVQSAANVRSGVARLN